MGRQDNTLVRTQKRKEMMRVATRGCANACVIARTHKQDENTRRGVKRMRARAQGDEGRDGVQTSHKGSKEFFIVDLPVHHVHKGDKFGAVLLDSNDVPTAAHSDGPVQESGERQRERK